ncbi:MAG: hypothetical protein IKK53_08335, partial [Ruminiclostridium sp.]|nr:hypothetical protein [Ruminiclostridium sp.]
MKFHGIKRAKGRKQKNVLTKGWPSDIINKLPQNGERKYLSWLKKLFEKNEKKVLTSDERYDIMYKLSSREGSESTLKIEQSKYELTTLEKFQVINS